MEEEKPYIEVEEVSVTIQYNPKYGDQRTCQCGHSYYRHFDTYENMEPVGCKYCSCSHFEEMKDWDQIFKEFLIYYETQKEFPPKDIAIHLELWLKRYFEPPKRKQ